MTRFIAIACCMFAAACATAEGYRQRTELYIGAQTDSLLLDWGPPKTVVQMNDGREMWSYVSEESYSTGGNYSQVPHERFIETINEKGEKITTRETVYESVYNPVKTYTSTCETRFIIAEDGIVETFSFTGEACVAPELQEGEPGFVDP